MKLTDTLTKQLKTIEADGGVTLYSCGPTVYDTVHLGNLRTFILDDVLRRTLRAEYGEKFRAVMNITDIDDKTIARAREEHPSESIEGALKASTRHYESLFLNDLAAVGVDTGLVELVRATEDRSIKAMQQLVRDIYANGFAYVSQGSVYFDLAAYTAAGHKYGRLSSVDFVPQTRIDQDEYERGNARDFVLWKAHQDGEPSWDLELGGELLPGRPGWHIECSAMAVSNLGLPLSLHSGAVDLIFPHHENELAQTQAGEGKELSQAFIHYKHLLVDGRKMSKSGGNFLRLNDIVEKGYNPLAFRLLVLESRYDSELNFTWERLDQAQISLERLRLMADLGLQGINSTGAERVFRKYAAPIQNALDSDLDTSTALQTLLATANDVIELPQEWPLIGEFLAVIDPLLGLGLTGRHDITAEQQDLIGRREAARQDGDFDEADNLRAQLLAEDIAIDDTVTGPRWHRTS